MRLTGQLEYSYYLLRFLEKRNDLVETDTTGNSFLRDPLPGGFYDFLYELPLDRPYLLSSNRAYQFINKLEFSYPFRGWQIFAIDNIYSQEWYDQSLYHFLAKEGVVFDTDETAFFNWTDSLNNNPLGTISRASQESLFKKAKFYIHLSKKYRESINKWYDNHGLKEDLSLNWLKKEWEIADYLLAEKFNFKNPLAFEIIRLRTLNLSHTPLFKELSAEKSKELLEMLHTSLSHPVLKREATRWYNEYAGKNKFQSIELPEGKGKEIFHQIINRHPGKFLFIDFWATWCSPCVGTITDNIEIRRRYKNNPDFEFIFITDETSPEEPYKKFIHEQELTHSYRLSTTDFNHLKEALKFHGIPKYMVVNKKGQLIEDNFGMGHFETAASFIPGLTLPDPSETKAIHE